MVGNGRWCVVILFLAGIATGCRSAPTITPRAASVPPALAPSPGEGPQPVRSLSPIDGHRIGLLAYSPNGRTLAIVSSEEVRLLEATTGRQLQRFRLHRDPSGPILFRRDGRTLVMGAEDGAVRFWDARTGRLVRTLRAHRDRIASIAFSPDERVLATGSADFTVRIWDTARWKIRRVLRGPVDAYDLGIDLLTTTKRIGDVRFSPDGRLLAISHLVIYVSEPMRSANYATVWDTRRWRRRRLLNLTEGEWAAGCYDCADILFTPDGHTLIAALCLDAAGGGIAAWDVSTGSSHRIVPQHEEAIWSLALFARGKGLIGRDMGRGVQIWQTETGKPLLRFARPADVGAIAVSPDGKTLAVGDDQGALTFWKLPAL